VVKRSLIRCIVNKRYYKNMTVLYDFTTFTEYQQNVGVVARNSAIILDHISEGKKGMSG